MNDSDCLKTGMRLRGVEQIMRPAALTSTRTSPSLGVGVRRSTGAKAERSPVCEKDKACTMGAPELLAAA